MSHGRGEQPDDRKLDLHEALAVFKEEIRRTHKRPLDTTDIGSNYVRRELDKAYALDYIALTRQDIRGMVQRIGKPSGNNFPSFGEGRRSKK